ncbi:DUF2999 family protein [Pseudomonas aeruginosa]|nr:DUF2999 family protein [Pseudomonas aeruginosa]MCA6848033.1 DUF2999 family protein [Pseudomonas aeruginosa]MCA6860764.1 DUF2999 family protein [Pseudomonas aeruginosa]MCA6880308.1 DUF2999 family protein [Pseudomonas aeruginosa]MCC0287949.1 DUF2999 family protein [Pseudomonas aeruginosa]
MPTLTSAPMATMHTIRASGISQNKCQTLVALNAVTPIMIHQ